MQTVEQLEVSRGTKRSRETLSVERQEQRERNRSKSAFRLPI